MFEHATNMKSYSANDVASTNRAAARRAVLLSALVLGTCLAQLAWRFTLPGDGWFYPLDAPVEGQRFVPENYVGELPTQLQSGDMILAIEGQPIADMVGNTMRLQPQPPQNWRIGGEATYLVKRDGLELAVPVTLGPRTIAQYFRAMRVSFGDFVGTLLQLTVAVFVFLQRPAARGAQIFFILSCVSLTYILSLLLGGQNGSPSELFSHTYWPAMTFSNFVYPAILVPGIAHLFLVFPVVKRPMRSHPHLMLVLLYGMPLLVLVSVLVRNISQPLQVWPAVLTSGYLFIFPVSVIITLGSLIHTAFRNKRPRVIAQSRFLLFGYVASFLIGDGVLFFLVESGAVTQTPLLQLATRLLLLVFPITLAICILRYQLFDIEVIVRKTTIYALLTGLLLLIYFVSIVFLQRLFTLVTGQTSTIAIVLSTLLIAALFLPLRRRLQNAIDRRFFRQKYDAEQVLTAFAATVRDETDLDALTAELVRVIQETMQPEFVRVWLKPVERNGDAAKGEPIR